MKDTRKKRKRPLHPNNALYCKRWAIKRALALANDIPTSQVKLPPITREEADFWRNTRQIIKSDHKRRSKSAGGDQVCSSTQATSS
jgi:hypothetical protein